MHKVVSSLHQQIPIVKIVVASSKNRNVRQYSSSAFFRTDIPREINMKNVDMITLIGGSIPNFISNPNIYNKEPYLYLLVDEFQDNNVYNNSLPNPAFAKIVYGISLTGIPFITVKPVIPYIINKTNENIGKLQTLTIRVLDSDGEQYDFGNDLLTVASFSNANPTTITTNIPHNLASGDKVYIEEFANGTTISINNTVNRKGGYIITVTGINTFTIPMDLSSQAIAQPPTGTETAYALGRDAKITDITTGPNRFIPGPSTFSNANPTTVTTPNPHGLATGNQIKIIDFNNGTTTFINDIVNQKHIVTVTGLNTFTIPVDLSTQALLQQKTDTQAPYILGQGSRVLVALFQTSFDFKFELTQKDNVLGI